MCVPAQIREHKDQGIYVEGMSEFLMTSADMVYDTLKLGTENRSTASTLMNQACVPPVAVARGDCSTYF